MHSRRMTTVFALCGLLSFYVPLSAASDFFIADKDTVLIWGNSITDYGVYPRLIENYVLTHYPDWRVEFYNLGWGGDQAKNTDRMRRDIQLCRPTKATFMLGMNDGGYRPFDQKLLETYLNGLKEEIGILKERSDPEIMLIAPTLYDIRCAPQLTTGKVEKFENLQSLFYQETLRRFSFELGKFAESEGLRFYDLNYSSNLTAEMLAEYDGNFRYTAESVHPNINGQLQMGLAILESMGAPALVAESVIDAAAGRVVTQADCAIGELKASGSTVSFSRTTKRLPLPVYPSTAGLMRTVLDYPDSWDRDIIRVTGLTAGWYRLSEDGRVLDVLSAAQLETGINLSRYANTAQMLQAYKVFEQTEIRQAAFWTKWRRVLLAGVGSPRDFTPFKTGVGTDSLDRVERQAFEAQHRLNKPAAHRYELTPVPSPAGRPYGGVPVTTFLDNLVKVHLSVDSRTLSAFQPPLCVRGNFSYAPQYQWGIIESKGYYANIPVPLYDDGTHGDLQAGDGVWSLDMYLRKNSGALRFVVYDGPFLTGYWNSLHPEYFRNPDCLELTRAWGALLGEEHLDKDGEIVGITLERDQELNWDRKLYEKALKEGKIYKP